MPEFEFPLSSQRIRFSLPAATAIHLDSTPFADLAATQAAVGRFLPETLAKIRTALAERLPPKPDRKSTPLRFQQVLLLLPDDSRRVGFDPWLSEIADAVTVADSTETPIPVQGFVVGQLDDPPLGLRLIHHIGEDFCGRFALESHHADREDDHDPEQEGLDATVLGRKTLLVAVRPVFADAWWTNALPVFLGRGLLARPLAEIIENAALDAVEKIPELTTSALFAAALQTELTRLYTPVVATLMPQVVDAPFHVDSRGEPLLVHGGGGLHAASGDASDSATQFDTVITAAGAAPNDLWFGNLVAAAQAACTRLKPGGQVLVVGACDEGLPFRELRETLTALQTGTLPRPQSPASAAKRPAPPVVASATASGAADADADELPSSSLHLLQRALREILSHADRLVFVSPGLVPEEDDDDSERERRELPAGERIRAVPTIDAALALATGTIGVIER